MTPPSGEYFLMQNIQPSGGIDIGYVEETDSGTIKNTFTYNDTQLWQRIPSALFSGYYYIKNVATGMYLSSPDSTSAGAALTMVPAIESGLQAWQFSETSSGAWKIRAHPNVIAGENLYINIKSSSNNTLVQDTHVQNSSYLDEFNVVMLGKDVVYNRTITWETSIDPSNMIADLTKYYDSYTLIQADIYMDLPTAQNLLENAKIMVFDGHGSPECITIHEHPQRYIYNTDIYNPNNTSQSLDLSDTDIVFFSGCSTAGNLCKHCGNIGADETHDEACPYRNVPYYNMPKSAECVGAKVAIGWSKEIDDHSNDWIDCFLHYMNTIDDATGQLYTAYDAYVKTNQRFLIIAPLSNAHTAVIHGTNVNFRLSD